MGSADITLEGALAIVSKRGWFSDRTDVFKSAVTKIARLRRFSPGEPIYLFGDQPDGIYGLVEGGLDVAIPRADGMDLTAHRADPGFWIGDLAMFVGQTRLVSLIAASRTQVIHLPQHALQRLVEAEPDYLRDFYALTYENMKLTLRLLANLATTPSEVRIAMRLLMYDDAEKQTGIPLSQSKLAELLGMSAPTLQRVLRRLQDDGLIEVGYGRIRVLDRRKLLSICSPA